MSPAPDSRARPEDELFFDTLVRDYIEPQLNPRFLRRDWLAKSLDEKLAEPQCRFLLLTGKPGSGKTVFMAQLAYDHPDWLRYFIRRDQRSPLADVSDKSFLLRIGYQLAAQHPELFSQEQLQLSVEQRVGQAGKGAAVVGAEVERLIASPFCQRVLQIEQLVRENQGSLVGLRVGELVLEPRLLSAEDLLQLALINPALALQRLDSAKRIVVLVDGLDEIRYHSTTDNILTWLSNSPELPQNIRFVLTSRPIDESVRLFCVKQESRLDQLTIAEEDPRVKDDAAQFASRLVREEPLVDAFRQLGVDLEPFARKATDRANGNLGYLSALARGISQALTQKGSTTLLDLLKLEVLPAELEGLYAFFLDQIKTRVSNSHAEFRDPDTGQTLYLPMWPTVYDRILGVLSVAMEPLDYDLLVQLAEIRVERAWVVPAFEDLSQFLEINENRYRLYHSTLAEFLTSENTRRNFATQCLYQDAHQWHGRICDQYWRGYQDHWDQCEDAYAFRHLTEHLVVLEDSARLHELICDQWMLAHSRQREPLGNIAFMADVERACSAASNLRDEAPRIVELFRLQAVRRAAGRRTSVHSNTDLATLVWLGQIDEAVAVCRLRSGEAAKCYGILAIATSLNERCEAESTAPGTIQELRDRARQLLKEAEWAALTLRSDQHRTVALAEVARGLDRMSDPRAEELFTQAKKIAYDRFWFEDAATPPGGEKFGVFALMSLAETLLKAQRFDDVEGIAHTIARTTSEDGLLQKLAAAMADRGRFEEAKKTAREIRGTDERAQALSAIAAALGRAGRFGEAEEMARSVESSEPQFKALCAIAAALGQAKDARATALFDELPGRIGNLPDYRQAEAMSALCTAFLQTARYSEAKEVIGKIPSGGERTEALVSLAQALAPSGDPDALSAARAINDTRLRASCLLDLALSLARSDEARAGKILDEAWSATSAVQDADQRLDLFSGFACKLARAGMTDRARISLTCVVQARLDRAQELLSSGKGPGPAVIAAVLTGVGCFAQAAEVARLITDPFQRFEALCALVGRSPDHIIDEALEAAQLTPQREEALCGLAEALAPLHHGRMQMIFDKALDAVRAIDTLGNRTSELCRLARIAKAAQMKQAAALLKEAEKSADSDSSRANVSEALAQIGSFAGAERVANQISDQASQSRALGHLAVRLAESGRPVKACSVAAAITDPAERLHTLITLASAFAPQATSRANSCVEEALRVVETIEEEWILAPMLCELGCYLAQTGDARSSEVFTRAAHAAGNIEDAEARSEALTNVGLALHQVGAEGADGMFNAARSAADDTTGPYEFAMRDQALMTLASALIDSGRLKAAEDVAHAIEFEETKAPALRKLAVALVLSGQETGDAIFDEAGRQRIQKDWVWIHERRELVLALARAGRYLRVLKLLESLGLDDFVNRAIEVAPCFEALKGEAGFNLVREVIGVAGWVVPSWRQVHDLLMQTG
jgi:hypothetical protein